MVWVEYGRALPVPVYISLYEEGNEEFANTLNDRYIEAFAERSRISESLAALFQLDNYNREAARRFYEVKFEEWTKEKAVESILEGTSKHTRAELLKRCQHSIIVDHRLSIEEVQRCKQAIMRDCPTTSAATAVECKATIKIAFPEVQLPKWDKEVGQSRIYQPGIHTEPTYCKEPLCLEVFNCQADRLLHEGQHENIALRFRCTQCRLRFENKLLAYEHIKQEHFKGASLEGFAETCILDPIIDS